MAAGCNHLRYRILVVATFDFAVLSNNCQNLIVWHEITAHSHQYSQTGESHACCAVDGVGGAIMEICA